MGWISLIASLVLAAGLSDARPNLTGVITADEGTPLAGATVYIYTAGVRTGYSPFCPSCYADCGKRTTTDAQGHFEIRQLDPELLFRVLVVADGYEPKFAANVDPGKGEMNMALSERHELPSSRQQWLKGRVVDREGNPIVGAIVEPSGCKTAERRWWGAMPKVDPMAISDQSGQFIITTREDVEGLDLQIRARGMVTRNFKLAQPGTDLKDFQLSAGSFVKGRLLKNGQPMSGIAMGLVQDNRGMENYVGDYTIATDSEGKFLFSNVVSDQKMYVYGKMESLKSLGAVPIRACMTSGNGQTNDVGDLEVQSAYTLAGKVALADGKALPENMRVLLSREKAWDSQVLVLAKDGTFRIENVPVEVVSVTAAVSGYRLSKKNVSLDVLNGFSIKGVVNRDNLDLTVLLEPGKIEQPNYDSMSNDEQQKLFKAFGDLETKPLQGIADDH